MSRVGALENLLDIPHPCEYFDLICGSGLSSLIAIMLGRLRMVRPYEVFR